MNREIKFRGRRLDNKEWVYGYFYNMPIRNIVASFILTNDFLEEFEHGTRDYDLGFKLWKDMFPIDKNTIGQFTGLYDKNGTPIYEGDIVEFYETKSYCINPDCEPHIRGYGTCIYKRVCEVKFVDGVFGVESRNEFVDLEVLAWCGLHTEELEDMKEMEESDAYFDTNGFDINDSIVGIKVIGNIHDNFDLMK